MHIRRTEYLRDVKGPFPSFFAQITFFPWVHSSESSSFASNTHWDLDVFRHDHDVLGMDRAKVRAFEQPDKVGLAGFLQCHHGVALKIQVGLEVLGDLGHQSLER